MASMYRVLAVGAFVLAGFCMQAQGTMNIHLVSDTTVFLAMADIDSVGYQLVPPPPAMLVHLAGGEVIAYPVADIDSITYSPGGPTGTPQVATLPPASAGSVGALCRAVVGSVGASPVLARGVCYGTTQLPDLGGTSMLAQGTTGPFQVQLAGLQPGQTYFARVYATNAQGTSYGNQVSFTTLSASYLNPSITYGSMTDQEGNSYATVVIGTQEWMAENLRTTIYANADPIPNVVDDGQWSSLFTGAWAHYDNDSQYENPYGKIYNWYAVADPRSVCPTGWHVPTDAEWTILSDYLGGESIAGGKLKSAGTQYWNVPNTGATDEAGFSGLPGGSRSNSFGVFGYLGSHGDWWSASEAVVEFAWYRELYTGEVDLFQNGAPKREGMSVRCLRD